MILLNCTQMKDTLKTLYFEKILWQQGKSAIAGIDEAGRGPLAGPVVAAAVIFDKESEIIPEINDSKSLSAKKRASLNQIILQQARAVGIGSVDPGEIDRINILNATYKAMRQAVGRLHQPVDFLLIDGRPLPDKVYPHKAIPQGDRRCYSIAAASIVAKEYRDQLMLKYDRLFPAYNFKSHKGYGTRQHCQLIAQHLPSPIHRKSFQRVKEYYEQLLFSRNRRQIGRYGEDLAVYYLYQKGYEILARNFHFSVFGELDIIARKDKTLCFIEVKTQRKPGFAPPEKWVDRQKMEQLGQIADGYLSDHPAFNLDCRFDVIIVYFQRHNSKIKHYKDAFRL